MYRQVRSSQDYTPTAQFYAPEIIEIKTCFDNDCEFRTCDFGTMEIHVMCEYHTFCSSANMCGAMVN